MARMMLLATLTCGLVGITSPAWAQNNLDRCNDILRQDLFNKVNSLSQSAASERAAYTEYVLTLDSSKAYAEYLDAYESSKSQKTSGSGAGGFGWGFIDGDASFSHSFDRKLSETEFSKKFEEAKTERRKHSSSSSGRDASLISVYQSSVRDLTSVRAWEHCMTTRFPEPGLFAYGYRDDSGNPYVVVMWAPGTFAAANPVIGVKFTVAEPGMTIEGAEGTLEIATGSGAAFPVRFSNSNDRKAQLDSFAVLVNGELKSGSRLVHSFRSEAIVPRNIGPIPCSLIFTPNKEYDIGIFDLIEKTISWEDGEGFSMLLKPEEHNVFRRGSSGPQVMSYNAKYGVQRQSVAPVQLNTTGPEFSLVNPLHGTTIITGRCTGQGVVDARKPRPGTPISIRPR
jgi:hypothetical protein